MENKERKKIFVLRERERVSTLLRQIFPTNTEKWDEIFVIYILLKKSLQRMLFLNASLFL